MPSTTHVIHALIFHDLHILLTDHGSPEHEFLRCAVAESPELYTRLTMTEIFPQRDQTAYHGPGRRYPCTAVKRTRAGRTSPAKLTEAQLRAPMPGICKMACSNKKEHHHTGPSGNMITEHGNSMFQQHVALNSRANQPFQSQIISLAV